MTIERQNEIGKKLLGKWVMVERVSIQSVSVVKISRVAFDQYTTYLFLGSSGAFHRVYENDIQELIDGKPISIWDRDDYEGNWRFYDPNARMQIVKVCSMDNIELHGFENL